MGENEMSWLKSERKEIRNKEKYEVKKKENERVEGGRRKKKERKISRRIDCIRCQVIYLTW